MSYPFTDSDILGRFNGDNRTAETNRQRTAVARLTTYCECLIQSDKLSALTELNLRRLVNEACSAFDMAPVRQDNMSLDELDQQLSVIAPIVGA